MADGFLSQDGIDRLLNADAKATVNIIKTAPTQGLNARSAHSAGSFASGCIR